MAMKGKYGWIVKIYHFLLAVRQFLLLETGHKVVNRANEELYNVE